MATDRSIYDNIVGSLGYKTTVGPTDKGKVTKAINGQPASRPSAKLAQAAFDLARRITPLQPPGPSGPTGPPPGSYLKVAPRTYNYAPSNNSDPRFCVHGQPGVVQRTDGLWTDESGAVYDSDGRDTSGVRSRLTQVPGLRQADNSDGRGECELYDGLTAWPGDPTKNTGSWQV